MSAACFFRSSGVSTSNQGLRRQWVQPVRIPTLVITQIKEQRMVGCRLIRISNCIFPRLCAQLSNARILLSLPCLSMVITSSRQGLCSTTSFSFSSTSIVIWESGAASRRARINGVVRVRSPRCIRNVTRIFLRFNSTPFTSLSSYILQTPFPA